METGKYQSKYDVPDSEQYPYTRVDAVSDNFDDGCVWMTFSEFKYEAEKRMNAMLLAADKLCSYGVVAKANAPLHIW